MKPILQVALDLINADRALKIAYESIEGGADWIEIGTPLIKSEGMNIIRIMREKYPTKTIIADMKTMDTGSLETEMAAKAGADIICILGAADNSTIIDAVQSARKYGIQIMIDLINVPDPVKRARELEKLGIHYLCIHTGIDEQMKGKKPFQVLEKLVTKTNLPIAVAGGLNSETAPKAIQKGAQIIIIGGAITKAHNIRKATQQIKKAIITQKPIPTELYKKYDKNQIRDAFSKTSTSNISDAMHKQGALIGIRPIRCGFHLVGQALTVKTIDGDWAKPIEAIDKAEPGNVLVIDVNRGTTAIWGELATWSAQQKKLAGVVIDGTVRDLEDLLKLNFPIFTRYIAPHAGEPKGFGEIGAEIICGGQKIRTGDWIIGDDSGVVVVPQEIAHEICNRALDIREQENRIRQEIKQGGSLGSVLKLKKWEKKIG
ncbi:MAG: 3-hexulose-6-phosphate synthase [Candidatus Thermoplasmatota archaeon]